MATFDAFNSDNDPHGERDCATLTVDGMEIMFKIDYFDVDGVYGSDDPSDPAQTLRVLTLMLPSDY